MQDIAVVILNYYTAKYAVKCVNRILVNTDSALDIKIVVVDNAYLLSTFFVRPEQWKFYKILLASKPEKYSMRQVNMTQTTSDN